VLADASEAVALNDQALEQLKLGNAESAVDMFRAAIGRFTDSLLLRSNLAYALKYDPRSNGREIRAAAEEWAARLDMPTAKRPAPDRQGQLRVGYLSPDFRTHPVGFLIDGVLACHDPSRVEIYCYSHTIKVDPQTERLRSFNVRWRDVRNVDDAEAANMIRTDGIDILVDLAGHSAGGRLSLFAQRPAPVTINWVLGGAGTTGLKEIDYVVADAHALPPEQEPLYVESVIRLPRCYLAYCPPGNAPEVEPAPSLQSGGVTFGCFNNLAKVNHACVSVWAEILRRCPASCLAFETAGYERLEIQSRLRSWFTSHGVDATRLRFGSGLLSQIEFLEKHALIDIGLDPFPYTGGMTTCDALWMGVPVVTFPGEGVHARHGATILKNAGLDFCVARSRQDYIDIAIRLASNIPALADLRRRMRPRLMGSSLCNVVGLTKELEEIYDVLWRRKDIHKSGALT
jgi:predicted O-linked N-acetylglucosamine transferase (SPINDLY family)